MPAALQTLPWALIAELLRAAQSSTLVAGLTWSRNLVFTPESLDSATLPVRAISRMPYGCRRPCIAVIFCSLPCTTGMQHEPADMLHTRDRRLCLADWQHLEF